METIDSIASDIGDTFKGIFNGGGFSEMSTGKKVGVIVIGVLVVIAIVGLVYLLYTSYVGTFMSTRRVGPAGCCGKLQAARIQQIETMLSDQDLQQAERARASVGMPHERTFYPGNDEEGVGGIGMYDNGSMGFTSGAKPTADEMSATSDRPCCGQTYVRPQVPNNNYIRPSYGESDFLNMAYSA
jgi:hypothetical protein